MIVWDFWEFCPPPIFRSGSAADHSTSCSLQDQILSTSRPTRVQHNLHIQDSGGTFYVQKHKQQCNNICILHFIYPFWLRKMGGQKDSFAPARFCQRGRLPPLPPPESAAPVGDTSCREKIYADRTRTASTLPSPGSRIRGVQVVT